MNTGTILSLIDMALKVFHDERQDKYLKKYIRIKQDYQNELNKGIDSRSDLKLDELRNEAISLAELVTRENSRN